MWRRALWLVGTLFVVNVAQTWRPALAQPNRATQDACNAVMRATAGGSEQLALLVESDPARFNPALLHLLNTGSGKGNSEYAALLAAQGDRVFYELLSLYAGSDEGSRLFWVARKWPTPLLAKLIAQLELPSGKTRAGAERAVMWLVADRARGIEMFRLLQEQAPERAAQLEVRLAPVDWAGMSTRFTADDGPKPAVTLDEVAALTGWLENPRPHVVRWAINSLAALGPDVIAASAPLQAWLEPRLATWDGDTTRSGPYYTYAVLPSLDPSRSGGPHRMKGEPVGPLYASAEGDLIHDALIALQRIDPNSDAGRALIRPALGKLKDPLLVRVWLHSFGTSEDAGSIELLSEGLQFPDPLVRQTAAVALGRLGTVAAPAAEALRAAIEASRSGDQSFAAENQRPNSHELVFRQAAEAALRAIEGQVVDFDSWVELSPEAFGSKAHLYRYTPPSEANEQQLAHWSVETRRRAVNDLSYRSDVPEKFVELLLGQLNAPGIEVNDEYRATLVDALARHRARPALPALLAIAASRQEAEYVRAAAARAAAKIAPNDPLVIDGLIAVLSSRQKHESAEVHSVAAELLSDMPAAAGKADSELERLRREGSEPAPRVASIALGKLSAEDPSTTEGSFTDRLKAWPQLAPAKRMGLVLQLQKTVEEARTAAKFDSADPQPLPRDSEVVALLPLILAAYQQSTDKEERFWLLNVMNRIGPESTPEHVQAILDAEAYPMLESLHVSDRTTLPLLVERYEQLKSRTDLTHTGEHWLLNGIARYGVDARPVALEVLPELDAARITEENYFNAFESRVEVLVAAGRETPGVLPTLVDLLNASWPAAHESRRIKLIQALGRLGLPEDDAQRARFVASFAKSLKFEDKQVALAAADVLQTVAKQLTDQERRALVPGLLQHLNQDDLVNYRRYRDSLPTSTSAIRCLGAFGPSASDAVPVLEQVVAGWARPLAYGRRDNTLANEAFEALALIRGDATEGLAALRLLATAAEKGTEQVAELIELDRERYLPALVAAVESGPSGLRRISRRRSDDAARSRVLAQALADQGEAALPALLPRFEQGCQEWRLVRVIDHWPPATVRTVVRFLGAENLAQRVGAEQVLIWLAARPAHGPVVVEALLASGGQESRDLETRLQPLNWPIRPPEPLPEPAPAPVDQEFLVRLLEHERPQIARWAINSLAGLGQAAKPSAPALRKWLAPRLAAWDGETTRSAPWQQFAPPDSGHTVHVPLSKPVPWLMFAASEGDLIHDSIVALYCLDPDSPETLEAVRKAASLVRNPLYAELWLTRLGLAKDAQTVKLLADELANPDPIFRQAAAVGLGRIGPQAAEAKAALQRAIEASRAGKHSFRHDLHRRRWEIDRYMPAPRNEAEALAAIALARSPVFQLDPELKFRQAAEAASKSLGGEPVDFELWVDNSADRSHYATPRWLMNFKPFEFDQERATRQLAHWSEETRLQAINRLREGLPDKAAAAVAIAQQLVAPGIETDAWFRQEVIQQLGWLGPDAKAAVPLLLEIVASGEEQESVRDQAAHVAARLARNDPTVIEAFLRVLADESKTAPKARIALELGDMPAAHGKAEPALQLLGQDATYRQAAMIALGKLAKLDQPVETPELLERLQKWGELSAAERSALLLSLTDLVETARHESQLAYSSEPLPRGAQPVAWLPELLAASQQSTNTDEKRQVLAIMGKIGPESTSEFVRVILDSQMYSLLASLHISDRSSLPLLVEARRAVRGRTPINWSDERDLLLGIARYGADARGVAEELLAELTPERVKASDIPREQFDAGLDLLAAAGPETPGIHAALFKLTDYSWPQPTPDDPLGWQNGSHFTTASVARVVQTLGRLSPPSAGNPDRAKLLALVDKQLRVEHGMPVILALEAVQRLAKDLSDLERQQLVEPLLKVLTEDQPSSGRGSGRWSWPNARRLAAAALGELGLAASSALPTLDAFAAEDPTVMRESASYGDGRERELAGEAQQAAAKIRQASRAAK